MPRWRPRSPPATMPSAWMRAASARRGTLRVSHARLPGDIRCGAPHLHERVAQRSQDRLRAHLDSITVTPRCGPPAGRLGERRRTKGGCGHYGEWVVLATFVDQAAAQAAVPSHTLPPSRLLQYVDHIGSRPLEARVSGDSNGAALRRRER